MNVCNTLQQALINNVKKYAHLKHNENMDEIAEYKKERKSNTSAGFESRTTTSPVTQAERQKKKIRFSPVTCPVMFAYKRSFPGALTKLRLNGQSSSRHVTSIAVAK